MIRFKFDGTKLFYLGRKIAQLEGNNFFDENGSKVGSILLNIIFDAHGTMIGTIKGTNIFDGHGTKIGSLSDVEGAIDGTGPRNYLAALWYLFIRTAAYLA